jgi:hypothetical protein
MIQAPAHESKVQRKTFRKDRKENK